MGQSIFEKCGGFASVRKVVSSFYDYVLDSPKIAPYFADSNMQHLVEHQTQFISYLMGGPYTVSDDALERAHASLNISRPDFTEIIELLTEAMEDHNLDPEDIRHVQNEMKRREHLIVTRIDPPS
jgi:hemoglobin